jgi:uncharacterized protein involved in exopolysaccharide biosynthesis
VLVANPLTTREEFKRLGLVARRALRRWWWVALATAAGVAVGLGVTSLRKQVYQSETALLYRDLTPISLVQGVRNEPRDLGQHIGDMLRTRRRFEKTIQELGLYPDVVREQGMPAAVELMRRDVDFRAHGTGSTFVIRYRSDTAQRAQKVTAALADGLIADDTRLRIEEASTTTSFLKAERERIAGQQAARETALAEFLAKHPEFAREEGETAGAAVRATTDPQIPADPAVAERVFTLTRQRDRLRARLSASPAAVPPDDSAAQEARIVLDNARREMEAAQRELDSLLTRYTDKHVDVVAARSRVAAAQARFKEAQAAVPPPRPANPLALTAAERAQLENEIAEIEDQISAINASRPHGGAASPPPRVTPKPKDAQGLVELETQWRRLNREVSESREYAQVLESRLLAAEIIANADVQTKGTRMEIIDPAFLPIKPIGARRSILVVAITALFTGLALVIVLVLAWADDCLRVEADVERLGLGPVLAFIPAPRRLPPPAAAPEPSETQP